MEIVVTELEPCKLLVNYQADAGQILNKRGEIMDIFRNAPVPGFRKGKADSIAINAHYGKQIEESLKRGLAEDSYHNTLFEKKIKPHGAPKFNNLLMADGKFTCEFELYTKPDFELAPYKEMEIPKPHQPVNEITLTEQMLQELRVRFGDITPYTENDFVQAGDNVILNYESFIDGVRVDNLCSEAELLTIGSNKVPMIEENVLGMKVDELREFDVTAPATSLPSMANKVIHFKVTVTTGSKNVPMPLDDSLAEKVGMKDMQELREFVHKAAMGKMVNAEKTLINQAVSIKLVDDNKMNVPNWMSLSEARYLVEHAQLNWDTLPDEDKEKYIEMGEKNAKLALVLDRIREVEPEAVLSDKEIFEMIKQNLIKTKHQMSLDDIIQEMNRTGQLQILFARLKDENTLDFVVKNAKIIE
jgi:trigger factor